MIRLITDNSSVAPGDEDLMEVAKQLEATETMLEVTVLGGREDSWTPLALRSSQVELVSIAAVLRELNHFVKPVEQRAKARLTLDVSPDLQIPVSFYTHIMSAKPPPLKRRSKMAAAIPAAARKTDNVISERTYHVMDDLDGEEVKPEEKVKGHKYGQSIVPMSEYDEAACMYTCERCLTVLGFATAHSIGPEHSMKQVEVLAADKGDRWAHCAFDSLVSTMAEESLVLIARHSFRKNSDPRMAVLFPVPAKGNQCATLEVQSLPFQEDIREWPYSSLPTPSAEQRDAAVALVDAMDLDAAAAAGGLEVPKGGEEPELFRPEDTYNPALRRFYEFLVHRAADPKAPVPAPAKQLLDAVDRPARIAERVSSAKLSERLKAAFVLEKVEKPTKRGKKRFWREALAEKRKEAALGEVDVTRIKVDSKKEELKDELKYEAGAGGAALPGAAHLAAPVGIDSGDPGMAASPAQPPPRVHIGSVHPERDFEHWLAYRKGGMDVVGIAVEQMQAVVRRLLEEGEDFHAKALGCLATLRRGCVKEGEASTYNAFARALRLTAVAGSGSLQERFWTRARDASLGLITDAEVPTSTVTADEARAFLLGESLAPLAAPSSSAGASAAAVMSERELEAMLD